MKSSHKRHLKKKIQYKWGQCTEGCKTGAFVKITKNYKDRAENERPESIKKSSIPCAGSLLGN